MAQPNGTATKETRAVVSPSQNGVKREHLDGEEETRRVSQRTAGASDDTNAVKEVQEYIKKMARSNDEKELKIIMRKLLENLYDQNDIVEKQQAFLQIGGPITIVLAMEKHPNYEELQLDAFGVLINSTFNNAQLETAVGECEGLEAIVAAMKRFPSSNDIQMDSLKAFFNLTNTHAPNAKIIVMATDGVQCIMDAMKMFPNDTDVMHEGCSVLFNLSKVESLKKPLRNANVITALAGAIDGHKGHKEIQECACEAMKSLM